MTRQIHENLELVRTREKQRCAHQRSYLQEAMYDMQAEILNQQLIDSIPRSSIWLQSVQSFVEAYAKKDFRAMMTLKKEIDANRAETDTMLAEYWRNGRWYHSWQWYMNNLLQALKNTINAK